MTSSPVLVWRTPPVSARAAWLSGLVPPPARAGRRRRRTTAAAALARARRGEALVYAGDYHNARQLLGAMARRLGAGRPPPPETRAPRAPPPGRPRRWRSARTAAQRVEHECSRGSSSRSRRAGASRSRARPGRGRRLRGGARAEGRAAGLLPLRELLGMVGAHEWRRGASRSPRSARASTPTTASTPRSAASTWTSSQRRGGVARRGQARVRRRHRHGRARARPRARGRARGRDRRRARARSPAHRRTPRGSASADASRSFQADLFPEAGAADLVVSNPPWLPDARRSPLERAVYDPGGKFLERLVPRSRRGSRRAARRGS